MNARGEVAGRMALTLGAATVGATAIDEPSDSFAVFMVWFLGILFGMAPTISSWFEKENDEGRD